MLVEPNVNDEYQDATEEKYSDSAEKYCDKGADGAALLSAPRCVVGVFFDQSSTKSAVYSRDVMGWVVANEVGHWNLPSTSEIGRNSNTCPRLAGFCRSDGWRNRNRAHSDCFQSKLNRNESKLERYGLISTVTRLRIADPLHAA